MEGSAIGHVGKSARPLQPRAQVHRGGQGVREQGSAGVQRAVVAQGHGVGDHAPLWDRVRDVAGRLAMSESDLYRKQRFAIEAVAQRIAEMELAAKKNDVHSQQKEKAGDDKANVPAEGSNKI